MDKLNNIAKYDIDKTDEMFQTPYGSSRFTTYDRVYSETNEACDKIISKFDVKDKSVLTVLGSGDQAFQFYINGAKNVDLFDINKLTIYYYYLRIWHMKKYGSMYPEDIINTNYLKKLLCSVTPSSNDEKKAYLYWNIFVSKFDFFLVLLLPDTVKSVDVYSRESTPVAAPTVLPFSSIGILNFLDILYKVSPFSTV